MQSNFSNMINHGVAATALTVAPDAVVVAPTTDGDVPVEAPATTLAGKIGGALSNLGTAIDNNPVTTTFVVVGASVGLWLLYRTVRESQLVKLAKEVKRAGDQALTPTATVHVDSANTTIHQAPAQ